MTKTLMQRSALWAVLAVTVLAGCRPSIRLDQQAPIETRLTPPAAAASAAAAASSPTDSAPSSLTVTTVNVGTTPGSGNQRGAQAGTIPWDAPSPAERIVYFDYNSFAVKDDYQHLIEAQARQLRGAPKRGLLLEGHTDARGGHEYNLALGQKRADAVARILRLLGVDDSQIEAVSLGKERPAAEGAGEEVWAKNRRVEMKDR